MDFVYNECFDDPDKAEEILAQMPELEDFRQKQKESYAQAELIKENDPDLYKLTMEPLLTPQQEKHLFRQMNFFKYKKLLGKAKPLSDQLVHSNLRLAYLAAGKQRQHWPREYQNFDSLYSDAYTSVVCCVKCFNYAFGFKFSTYLTNAIRKYYYFHACKEQKHYLQHQTELDEDFLKLISDKTNTFDLIEEDDRQSHISSIVNNLLRFVTDRRQRIIRMTFCMDKTNYTLTEIGQKEGISKERVRQLRNSGLRLLRKKAAELNIDIGQLF